MNFEELKVGMVVIYKNPAHLDHGDIGRIYDINPIYRRFYVRWNKFVIYNAVYHWNTHKVFFDFKLAEYNEDFNNLI